MKKIMPIPIIISILVILFIIPMSYAIYRSYSTGGVTIAAASWNVSLNQNNVNNNLTIIPGENGATASYTINITSNSEVDVTYDVVISGLPNGVSVAFGDRAPQLASSGTVTITNAGTILYNAQNKTNTHTLTFSAASNATCVNNQSVTVNVIAKQILPS